jgi:chromosome segregation ATPase
VAVGAGVYFGVPWLYAQWIEPVQTHTAQIAQLSARLDTLRQSQEGAQAAVEARVTTLETAGDAGRERVSSAEARVAELEQALAEAAAAREAMSAEVAELRAALQRTTNTLSAEARTSSAAISSLETDADTTSQAVGGLEGQVALLQAQNTLLKARLQLLAENLGDARELLAQAASELGALVEAWPALTAEERAALTTRLDGAALLTESQTASALDELDAVWSQLDRAFRAELARESP